MYLIGTLIGAGMWMERWGIVIAEVTLVQACLIEDDDWGASATTICPFSFISISPEELEATAVRELEEWI